MLTKSTTDLIIEKTMEQISPLKTLIDYPPRDGKISSFAISTMSILTTGLQDMKLSIHYIHDPKCLKRTFDDTSLSLALAVGLGDTTAARALYDRLTDLINEGNF